MKWKRFGSKPTKSLEELKAEVEKLREAEQKTKAYKALQDEKEKIQKEIKQEGFKIKHRRALAIIHGAEERFKLFEKKAEPYARKYAKKYVFSKPRKSRKTKKYREGDSFTL